MSRSTPDLIIVGGGLIGCSVGWELARQGLEVRIVEEGVPGRGASGAAAGMLSPEPLGPEPGPLFALTSASFDLYPEFVERVREVTGIDPGYRDEGKLYLATDEEGAREFRDSAGWMREHGHEVEWLDDDEVRRLEPAVGAETLGALYDPRDHQIGNRRLTRAVWQAAAGAGVEFHLGQRVTSLISNGKRVRGVRVAGGDEVEGGAVLIAAGSWSGLIDGLPAPLPVRPVRGEIIVLEGAPRLLERVIAIGSTYIVPRDDGRVIIGATSEEVGFREGPIAGGVTRLLDSALTYLPSLESLTVAGFRTGFRPGTPDSLPILGRDPEIEGLYYATGHYRDGILLAPISAHLLAGTITDGTEPPILRSFSVERFRRARDGSQVTAPL